MSGHAAVRVGVLVALSLCCLGTVGLVTPAAAGDGIADFQFQNRTVDAQAGETVELELIVDSDGGYATGIGALGATVAVNSEYATITDVEYGSWLETGDGVEINQTKTVSAGRATVRQERLASPDDDGVTGRKRFVTVTVRIAPDAPPSQLQVGIPEADAELVRGFGLRTIQHSATIVVDGGGETIAPDTATSDSDAGGVGVTTATAVGRNGTNTTDDASGEQSLSGGETPGFGVIASLVALCCLGLALAARQYRSDDS